MSMIRMPTSVRCRENYLECQPQEFGKCQDRVLRGRRDGSFAKWNSFTDASPVARLGFGLVIANFDRQHGNDFFFSNDGDFNHFWISTQSTERPGQFELIEAANVRGCSVGRGGRSQACMGIASGDFDRNGTLDLHVTNFRNEPVNLFLQSDSGVFVDRASAYGLAKPSLGVLGFGTQAADLDNDGWLDLTVLNGHVYDARFEGTPFQMQPQLFRGAKEGFATQDPATSGEYWNQAAVGRTLAALDWNRDGGIDWLASHLDQPLALLQNESPRGHWLQMELVGVDSERDAIGTELRVRAGDESWTAWQTGGDGLMCSNEAVVHFGVGSVERIDEVQIRWPSGQLTTLKDLPIDRRHLVIEGGSEPFQR